MDSRPVISFEQFVDRALHDPKTGYYARKIKGVGRTGDFTTAPMLSDSLGCAITAWVVNAFRETGCRNLIEIGPGEGKLAAAVMKNLPWHIRWRTKLHLVETSVPLKEIQRKTLRIRAQWHQNPADALTACDGKAIVFSNELVDAFPVRRFQKTENGWREIGVRLNPIEETFLETTTLPESSSFDQSHPIGQRIEVHESYQTWLQSWIPAWKAGRMLTIDYGSTAEKIYHRRPRGTVRSYLFQQRGEGSAVYENPGRQDITADVNFTDLIDSANDWAESQILRTFREFVSPFVSSSNLADQQLIDEEGSGSAFLVLDQNRKS